MSQLKLNINDPRSGRLITTADLDRIGLNLQLMLNLTNNNTLRCPDAWAQGNTDAAFACNNFVGVQRSHRDNDYNYGWVDFSAERGTYLYTPGEAYLMQQITKPVTGSVEIATKLGIVVSPNKRNIFFDDDRFTLRSLGLKAQNL
jgi:hypothetical protein